MYVYKSHHKSGALTQFKIEMNIPKVCKEAIVPVFLYGFTVRC